MADTKLLPAALGAVIIVSLLGGVVTVASGAATGSGSPRKSAIATAPAKVSSAPATAPASVVPSPVPSEVPSDLASSDLPSPVSTAASALADSAEAHKILLPGSIFGLPENVPASRLLDQEIKSVASDSPLRLTARAYGGVGHVVVAFVGRDTRKGDDPSAFIVGELRGETKAGITGPIVPVSPGALGGVVACERITPSPNPHGFTGETCAWFDSDIVGAINIFGSSRQVDANLSNPKLFMQARADFEKVA